MIDSLSDHLREHCRDHYERVERAELERIYQESLAERHGAKPKPPPCSTCRWYPPNHVECDWCDEPGHGNHQPKEVTTCISGVAALRKCASVKCAKGH